jgi:hypothetical protein
MFGSFPVSPRLSDAIGLVRVGRPARCADNDQQTPNPLNRSVESASPTTQSLKEWKETYRHLLVPSPVTQN